MTLNWRGSWSAIIQYGVGDIVNYSGSFYRWQGATIGVTPTGTGWGPATGILKNTTTAGVPDIAIAGVDYVAPSTLATLLTPTKSVSTNYSTLPTDCVVLCTAGSGGITITLLSATANAGRSFTIKQVDPGGGGVSIATTGGQTIDTLTNYELTNQNQFVTVISDGNDWQVIGAN